ncbi:helix-turn-helix domain-containing protein [Xylocopilactobacillus apicola]|uniref:Transcriptional regulator n=1 Tax=Xylocopilactobacillus apicola TaxID=2932184 RepID=A0AAU9CVS8_9LACO|nr:helix-turn-helix domain-containing protein [Xylocopilactobacillus apicola]BDR58102.1 transcriptional regulator [Xylocopilactobacillus apicola]
MIFEKLFLEKPELTRLKLYRNVLSMPKKVFKANELATVHKTTYQQTYNNLQGLAKDLQDFYGQSAETFFDGTDVFQESFKMPLSDYRRKMVTRTLPYNFIDAVFKNNFENLNDFLTEQLVSRSTLSRRTSTLHDYMRRFGIGLSYIDMVFLGDERKIREFLFIFYYSLSQGGVWPFENVSFEQARSLLQVINNNCFHYLYRNRVDEYQCIFRLAIAMERIEQGYTLSRNSRLDLLVKNNRFFNVEKSKQFGLFQLSSTYSFNEIEELFFAFNHSISPFTKANVNDHNLVEVFSENDTFLWDFVINYLEFLANSYSEQLSQEVLQDPVLLANLIRIFYSYFVFAGSFPTMADLFESESNLTGYNQLIDITKDFILKNAAQYQMPDIITNSRLISNDIYQLLLPVIGKVVSGDAIQVKLYLEEDIVASRDLTTFLSDLKGIHVLSKADPVDLADIVVTPLGSLGNLPNVVIPENVKMIYWNSEDNEDEFYRIYRQIRSVHIERKATNQKTDQEDSSASGSDQVLA